MAERPVFIPCLEGSRLVREVYFSFQWHSGFAPVQKKKNIVGLHHAAAEKGIVPLLEVSTKSEDKLGQRLSAFSLKVASAHYGDISLESAYQGSKMFERGGPFTDLYHVEAREAKKDPRVRDSGRIVAFRFDGMDFPSEPKTAFYDWLYSRAIFPHREWLKRLEQYAGFTDIEFNPEKSLNCQARSCAIFVSMMKRGILERAQQSPEQFIAALKPSSSTEPAPGDERGIERAGDADLYNARPASMLPDTEQADHRLKGMVQHVADQTPQSIIIGVRLDGPVSSPDRVHYPLTAVAGTSIERPDYRATVLGLAKLAETIDDLIDRVAPQLGVSPAEMRDDVRRQREP